MPNLQIMPVTVNCPGCNSELTAPDEMIGQMASCPQCKSQFHVANGSEAPEPTTPPAPPSEAPRRQGAVPVGLKSFKGRDVASAARAIPNPAEPPSMSSTAPSTGPASPPIQPTEPPKPRQQKPRRRPKQAKFITADATQTKVLLGADGQLPELVLREADAKEKKEAVSSSGSSPLMIVALVVSIVFSVILLLADLSGSRGENVTKQDARETLKKYHIGGESDASELEPYQLLIREALKEHSSDHEKAERRLYKQVLDMLHAEGKNRFGVTGRVPGSSHSDKHLEKLINTLLRE